MGWIAHCPPIGARWKFLIADAGGRIHEIFSDAETKDVGLEDCVTLLRVKSFREPGTCSGPYRALAVEAYP